VLVPARTKEQKLQRTDKMKKTKTLSTAQKKGGLRSNK
jgi:hypothetical protein